MEPNGAKCCPVLRDTILFNKLVSHNFLLINSYPQKEMLMMNVHFYGNTACLKQFH